MKYLIKLMLVLLVVASSKAQTLNESNASTTKIAQDSRPKLVVGIVVDQMRYDYLTRFYDRYGDGGFKRMMTEGFNCKNNHFNYVPTYTGPGHASVYTGTTPKYHGIIGNDFYDRERKEMVYCAGDDSVQSVGTQDDAGKMSPHRMKTTSFTDENRLFTQMKGKTIGIALKDRGAILPAGHTANAAYWFHGRDEGAWITSTFYRNDLPKWVSDFNDSNAAEYYFKVWDTFYDMSTYTQSGLDENDFEGGFRGQEKATFPYDLSKLSKDNREFDILKATPYGNSLTTDFAMAAIKGEQLGKDDVTDVLTLSYSSTDYVGHNFGVNSKEIEDTYIRLDLDLERFFKFLDAEVGKGEYTVFLTSDHGAIEVPSYLASVKIPAGYLDNNLRKEQFNTFLQNTYGTTEIMENYSNSQIFLDRKKVMDMGLDLQDVQQAIANEQLTYEHMAKVYTATTMSTNDFTSGVEELLQNGFNQKRSGDVILVNDIGYISYGKTGSTHGSALNYDTHVPLLFFGKGIKQGATFDKTVISDIAPTMSALLGISFPNGSTGQPLGYVID
ncbi:alkaline phosphatase family protein [Subsaximicrobium wynnwilliamsii]|uniref:Alkaline phosphatase family protein n=1 Tax=Subsaximicrobium wynnwilliamsii TaxID=291179 RepID=A0A5C6ZH98_9FLAO|nr:alkaline phosphatase PafA [Subsaximicrobium wynnwilliamsii]TXD82838.1 alkaline phosphatase family protein [Subsaximicrobium wynnwilliamsii]TXD88560.1 alkaline phosphatase family protein [Subsaximicrobium wynnwilliamsii]TXE02443.1 alkaline phosphatase family protein [Subsaximicrobium wynnwilliamsii]